MDKITERFGGFLKIARVDHGELRFESNDRHPEEVAEAVADCLNVFTPWSTRSTCNEFMTANGGGLNLKCLSQEEKTDQNEMELRCCHILLEPTCYSRLMEDLGLDRRKQSWRCQDLLCLKDMKTTPTIIPTAAS